MESYCLQKKKKELKLMSNVNELFHKKYYQAINNKIHDHITCRVDIKNRNFFKLRQEIYQTDFFFITNCFYKKIFVKLLLV